MSYECDGSTFSAEAYEARGWPGIAWNVLGWELQPDEDTWWSGVENRTGRVVAHMVGDDREFVFDQEELTPLEREAYCGVCGQIGCCHDGYDRSFA